VGLSSGGGWREIAMDKPQPNGKTKLVALGDIHVGDTMHGAYVELFQQISQQADLFLLCGDLTQHGHVNEAAVLAEELRALTIPKLAVLGNHDYESNENEAIKKLLKDAGVIFLDEENYETDSIGITGVKGFGGGFGPYMLSYFGEPEIKAFVQAAIDETQQLEIGLGKLSHKEKKIVVMHYAPIYQTLIGEDTAIYPFLGATRFEEVIDRFDANLVFHGHAHYGSPHGKTTKGADVYNVAFPLMQKLYGKKPYKVIAI
jgi:Icc-related predicted phosphoesterase